MKAFKLLRPLGDSNTFLVPAMLPRQALPEEYVTPHWWCPSKASAAAVMHVEHVVRPAEMRIMYKVLGGRLPFGFMSELQVRLSQPEKRGDKKLHFAPEAAVVDRVAGSVLSAAYKCGGGSTREWVVLSRPLAEHAKEGEPRKGPVAADCICVMAWSELSSQQGATDWRVLRMVMKEIEEMEYNTPGLYLQKQALFVDTSGQVSKPFDISHRHLESAHASELLSFEFDDDSKYSEDVDPDLVLPSISETKLSSPQQPAQQPAVVESARHCVDAFFAKTTDDQGIDVHAEGQLMQRIVLNPGSGWECTMNPQPTIEDLYSSIGLARQRNVRVMHLAGHGKKECGFIWNASDSATARREFDVDAISLAIGSVAGQNGPMECVVLNACSTETMGRLLLQRGVPYVLCWRTTVQDETAKELCQHFYRALVENASGTRDYTRAFFAATDAVRSSAHTGGTANLPRGAEDVTNSKSVLHSSNTRSISPDGGAPSRGKVLPWLQQDVVLFLSKDGDSEPVYLWRKRMETPLPPPVPAREEVPGGAEEAALKALFAQCGLGGLCVDLCRELGVAKLADLSDIDKEMLDDLPNYLKDLLKPLHKKRLLALIAQPNTAGGQHREAAHAVVLASETQQSAAAQMGAASASTHAAAAAVVDHSRQQ